MYYLAWIYIPHLLNMNDPVCNTMVIHIFLFIHRYGQKMMVCVCVCREVTIYPSLSCPAPVGQSGRRWRAVMCSCRGFGLHSRSGVVSHVGGKAGFGLFTCLVPAKLLETWRIDVSRCVNPCIMALARNLVTCTNMCLSRDKEKSMQPVVSKNEP